MAYGCRPTCDHCRPKYVHCPDCGTKNFLMLKACKKCGREFSEKDKEDAIKRWEAESDTRSASACFMPQSPQV